MKLAARRAHASLNADFDALGDGAPWPLRTVLAAVTLELYWFVAVGDLAPSPNGPVLYAQAVLNRCIIAAVDRAKPPGILDFF